MTHKISIPAGEVRIGDQIYDGPGANAHPTFAWETVTKVNQVDGLMVVVAGRLGGANGEFLFDPDEAVAVIRHPPEEEAPAPVHKAHNKHGHGHAK